MPDRIRGKSGNLQRLCYELACQFRIDNSVFPIQNYQDTFFQLKGNRYASYNHKSKMLIANGFKQLKLIKLLRIRNMLYRIIQTRIERH